MRQHALLILAVGWMAVVGGQIARADIPENQAIKQDRLLYKGTWRVVSLEMDGVKASSTDIGTITVANQADGTWIVKFEGKEVARGTSRIYPMQNPKAIDITGIGEGGQETAFLGIYALQGDSRKVCFSPFGKDRPTEFSSRPGSGHILIVFEREKK